ncbi:MAG: ABC transporter substrate-binding protein, partial [Anaerolineales bacterium]
IDIALNLPPEDLESLEANENVNVITSDSLTLVHSEMKQTVPPFSIQEVRLAMNLAIDNQSIIDNIMKGAATIPQSPEPQSMDCFYGSDPYGYDPERAKELLSQAGYPNGFKGTLWYIPGRWGGDTQVAEAMQAYWRAVGIEMDILTTDQSRNNEIVFTDPAELPGWTSLQIRTSGYANYHLYRLFHSTSSNAGYSNPNVDALLEQARQEIDNTKKCDLLTEAQKLIWEDAPFIEVFVRQNLLGVRDNVTGFEQLPTGDLRLTEADKN